jgi:hypothetical protein
MISFELFCEEDYHHAFVMAPSAVLNLRNSSTNLPSNPYGFWVNKWGHWTEVPHEGHASSAVKIIKAYAMHAGISPEDISGKDYSGYRTMFRHGYIRMVVERDLIHWEHPSKAFTPTQSQVKFFKELEMEYHLPVKRDTAASVEP